MPTTDWVFRKLAKGGATLRGLGVAQVGVFGSFARGTQTEASDVDLLVKFEKEKKPSEIIWRQSIIWRDFWAGVWM